MKFVLKAMISCFLFCDKSSFMRQKRAIYIHFVAKSALSIVLRTVLFEAERGNSRELLLR